jgi:hypothetical protein
MKKQTAIIAALLVVLTGCATHKYTPKAKFDEAATQDLLKDGPNSIKGSALIRQGGGGVVTCAGQEALLAPATAYQQERMFALYGNFYSGYNPAFGGRQVEFQGEDPGYKYLIKRTTCDAQGSFKFEKIADGDFYVVAVVLWKTDPYFYQGGTLMQRVTVKGGETKEIVLAP